jgi:hypothetical protein
MMLTDYYTAVGDHIPTLSSLSTAAVYRMINKARRMVARQTDATIMTYPFTFTINQQPYPYPTVNSCTMKYIMETYYYIGNLRQPVKGSLTQLPAGGDLLLNYYGWPVAYSLLAGNVLYWPIPSFGYSAYIKGKLEPIDITSTSGNDSIIPTEYQDAVVILGAKNCALLDGNMELALALQELYKDELRSLPREFM